MLISATRVGWDLCGGSEPDSEGAAALAAEQQLARPGGFGLDWRLGRMPPSRSSPASPITSSLSRRGSQHFELAQHREPICCECKPIVGKGGGREGERRNKRVCQSGPMNAHSSMREAERV